MTDDLRAENHRLRAALQLVQRLLEQSSQHHIYLPVNVMQARDVILTALRAPNVPSSVYRTPDIVIATVLGDTPDGVISAVVDNPPYVQTDSYEVIKEHHDG